MLSIFLHACLAAPGAQAQPAPEAAPARIQYVVTIHPLAELVRAVAGKRAEVIRILPPGSSPHTYDPKPSDAAALETALAFFHGSPLLDGWAGKLSAKRSIALIDLLPIEYRLPAPTDSHAHDHAHDHAPVGGGEDEALEPHDLSDIRQVDPHFWTDPRAIRALLPALVEELARLDPAGAAAYRDGAAQFAARLDALDVALGEKLAIVRGRPVMLFHPSFCYMLKRYGLKYAGSIEPFPGKEATPRYLQGVISQLREQKIKAVFTEPQLPKRPAQVVAEAAGLPLRELDPNGGRTGRMTLEELLTYNATTLAEALE